MRELEGALKRVIANAHFTGREISIDLVRESLKDLLALQDRLVSVDNIQRVVAEYYKIKVADLLSKRRSRSVARPAKWLCTSPRISPITACLKLEIYSAVGTIPPYYMPAEK